MAVPEALVRALVEGPSVLSGLEWHDEVGSTNALAAEAAGRGVPEVHAVLADRQTAGRGRHGRAWTAPAGTSLLLSLVLRPDAPPGALPLLPLLVGLALAEATAPFCSGAQVALKWPNDLLIGERKAAGVLLEALPGGACVVGIGCNVDWRGVARPPAPAEATSLVEAAGHPVDRWRVLAALVGVLGNRYVAWRTAPTAFLDDYRRRSATLGRRVLVTPTSGAAVQGLAVGVGDDGTLRVRPDDAPPLALAAGDVFHVRPD